MSEAVSSTVTASVPRPPLSDRDRLRNSIHHLVFGAVAGTCAKTAVAPLDRVKILLQVRHPTGPAYHGLWSTLGRVWEVEGFWGLFRGNGVQVMRVIPYAGIQFSVFEFMRSREYNAFQAGAVAGTAAAVITYPFDLLRARLAWKIHPGSDSSNGHAGNRRPFLSSVVAISREHPSRIRGFYRGLFPTILGIAPYGGTNFFVFESLKTSYVNFFHRVSDGDRNEPRPSIPVHVRLLCGAIAGAVGQTVVYPLDTVRRRMQVNMTQITPEVSFSGSFEGIYKIAKHEGIKRGLLKGLSVNYIRSVPAVSISFTVFDLLRGYFHS